MSWIGLGTFSVLMLPRMMFEMIACAMFFLSERASELVFLNDNVSLALPLSFSFVLHDRKREQIGGQDYVMYASFLGTLTTRHLSLFLSPLFFFFFLPLFPFSSSLLLLLLSLSPSPPLSPLLFLFL